MSGSMNVTFTIAQGFASSGTTDAQVGDDIVVDLGVAPKALEIVHFGANATDLPSEAVWSEKLPSLLIFKGAVGATPNTNGLPTTAQIASTYLELTDAGVLTLKGPANPGDNNLNPGVQGFVHIKAYY